MARTIAVIAAFGPWAALVPAGCSAGAPKDAGTAGPCPVPAIRVVVSVDQWSDIVQQLAGACGRVSTVVSGSSADPHMYELTAADSAAFGGAQLVVVNGLGYDAWASRAVDALSSKPATVNAGQVVGLAEGANPHIWYGPGYVEQVAQAVTGRLTDLLPGAADYLHGNAVAWEASMQPYRDEVAAVVAVAKGKPFGATEPVFDEMARALGLVNVTPEGYRHSAANRSEPSPGDINAFDRAIDARQMALLVYNDQTQGAVPDQLRQAAGNAGIPVVSVTETLPTGVRSFVTWQVDQLQHVRNALGPT